MAELGTYIKLSCDTEGCEAVTFAPASLSIEYIGYDKAEPVSEVETLPAGWGATYPSCSWDGQENFYCPACCDKIDQETGCGPIKY